MTKKSTLKRKKLEAIMQSILGENLGIRKNMMLLREVHQENRGRLRKLQIELDELK